MVAISLLLSFVAAAEALTFAVIVYVVAGKTTATRTLATALFFEALIQGAFASSEFATNQISEQALVAVAFAGVLALAAIYPWILRSLNAPITSWFRRRRFLLVYTSVVAADAFVFVSFVLVQSLRVVTLPEEHWILNLAFPAFMLLGILSIIGLVGGIWAFRRAEKGATKERARAFAFAFGARDSLMVLGILTNISSGGLAEGYSEESVLTFSAVLFALATIVYIPLLAYGILKTQLFDIDIKIKVGLRRSTVVTIALIAVLGAAKVAEFYLNKTFGLVAGGLAAGIMLVLAPRLNKLGEKVANATLPQVQPTTEYIAFKKLEVYRAAVETALETGGIDDRERLKLERLRGKLGIAPFDATAIESDATGAAAPKPA